MRELLLVVPDLLAAGASSGAGLEARPVPRLRFGPARPLRTGWRAWAARWLGRPELDARPVAELVAATVPAAASVPDPATARGAWLATPLHLVAGLDTVQLPRDGIVALTPEEREALAADFTRALGGGRLALVPAGPEAFVLLGLDVDAVHTVDPVDCLGSDLANLQPTGAAAMPLRRLMSEIEMWLHEHAVNLRRVARGARPLRALWLWGGATPSRPAPVARPESPAALGAGEPIVSPLVFSDDAWMRAATALAGAELAAEGTWPGASAFARDGDALVTARFHGEDVPDAATFEARYLEPAFAALREGALERLTLVTADRRIAVEAADRYRLWRPRRDWLTALGT